MDIQSVVREAGVVGAGGAGFPTHVKLAGRAEYVLANGAECEPLLHKDAELTQTYTEQVIKGMELSMRATGADKAIFGIKAKRAKTVAALEEATRGNGIKIQLFGDYYPAGDEFVLVYECTGRLIPAGGIPLQVGAVVHNSETLYNMAEAAEGRPVTKKVLTVTGEVKEPMSMAVPVGITLREAIDIAGGPTTSDFAVFVGGLMMGKIVQDLSQPVTKTTGGLIVFTVRSSSGATRPDAEQGDAPYRQVSLRSVQLLHGVLPSLPAGLRRPASQGDAHSRLYCVRQAQLEQMGRPVLLLRSLYSLFVSRGPFPERSL